MGRTGGILAAPTATKLGEDAAEAVVVCGSHGGTYAAYLVAASGARAAILFDAAVGLDEAGIGCLAYCQSIGMAAATIDVWSARIGDSDDALARGVISHANPIAEAAGCAPGMACREAAEALTTAPLPTGRAPAYAEARHVVGNTPAGARIVCVDSVSLVAPEDAGQVVVTGSHGGLVGGDPAAALRVNPLAALFNDAGIGIEDAGVGRLPALDERGIAAGVVATATARIGDGRSTLEDGVLSRVNRIAEQKGARAGMPAQDLVALF
jgi:hypothetical protein